MPTTKKQIEVMEKRKEKWAEIKDSGTKYKTPMVYDRSKIAEMLVDGKTLREISKIIGCSQFTVSTVKKELKKKNQRMFRRNKDGSLAKTN